MSDEEARKQGDIVAVAEFLQAEVQGLAEDGVTKLAVGTVVTKAFLDAHTRVKE